MPILLCIAIVAALATAPAAQTVTPPAGFTALYNGRDLTGWRGGDTYDHRKWLALPEAERSKLDADWTADMRAHWRADGAELVNDELGPRLATLARRSGPESTLRRIDALLGCRTALEGNVAPLLALESTMIALVEA